MARRMKEKRSTASGLTLPRRLPRWLIVAVLTLTLLFLGGTAAYSAYKSYRRRPPDQIHLAWLQNPATTMTVVWRTYRDDTPSVVEYRLQGATEWQQAVGTHLPSGTNGVLHDVTIEDLTPNTTYEYRVKGDYWNIWSNVATLRTAPLPNTGSFDVVYVADTGLVGRKDGLATGTQQIVDEIAKLNPLLVLAGGDYAYYDRDRRYKPLDQAIDVWFNQMMPIAHQSVMMPTFGNHEALLSENISLWAQRFATPEGFDDHHNYSFDVGNAHFVSIFAIYEQQGLPKATLKWIEDDIKAAKGSGKQWIIPFMHVSAFAEGASHPSNLALRAQLGPLFERTGVKLVLSSHDQAYERTYPLVDVPNAMTPTSTSKTCYTQNDGVTWIKTSPGGKKSNKSESFSIFKNPTPPAWTAYRNNTMHVFTQLHVEPAGEVRVKTFGVKGDGSPPVMLDAFKYTTGTCSSS